ncbi:hypothetical protein SLEP1_g53508 [Rubroshorea leprosula]|uniref:BHLH domain-containing protein n=1 Tax=Rubroshorea leprosula TaxID=152421 RepID=A0AAV5M9Q5_9ROSI|nr:hypothetical protein SLEP1_g53508 [Rubroshorea leprosula]
MAEFSEALQSHKLFLSETNSNLKLIGNQSAMESLDSTDAGFMAVSNRVIFDNQQAHQIPMNFPGEFQQENKNEDTMPIFEGLVMDLSPSPFSGTGLSPDFQGQGGRKRKRNNDQQKPKEVVHVRAKRGQATDSHSLAERVRRERIKEKLRCLQDLVPGCYKTMGMAMMLDVIINYVQSLQNQIEFLSMKLSAASLYHELSMSEMDATQTMQGQELGREGYAGAAGTSYFTPNGFFDCDH